MSEVLEKAKELVDEIYSCMTKVENCETLSEEVAEQEVVLVKAGSDRYIKLNGVLSEEQIQEVSWIPIEEKLPPQDTYILLSFSNYTMPVIGRYEEDENGNGNFYDGDDEPPLISYELYVNAWQPLPENYKPEGGQQDVKAK